jgi:ketosteroid isomerase-like protein
VIDSADGALAALLHEHVRAFNARDLDALLAGLREDALWVTGTSVVRGRAELAGLFGDAMRGLLPTLTVENLLTAADPAADRTGTGRAACQMTERMTVAGAERTDSIAAFFVLRDGLIAEAKVYREGSAVVES